MSASNNAESTTTKIVIKNLKYTEEEIRAGLIPQQDRKYYIKVILNSEVRQTAVSDKTNAPSWPDMFEFLTVGPSKLIVEVHVSHRVRGNSFIGRMEKSVQTLQGEEVVSHAFETKGLMRKKLRSVVTFNLTWSDSDLSVLSVEHPTEGVQNTDLVGQARDSVNRMDPVPFEQLLEKSRVFLEIGMIISELHPYTNIAFKVLSSAHTVMLAQKDRDEKIQQLVNSLYDFLDFLLAAEALKDLNQSMSHGLTRTQIRKLQLISEQVTECAHFIIGYSQNKHSGVRVAKGIALDYENTIKAHTDNFNKLKSDFEQHGVLVTEVTVLQTKSLVQQILDTVDNMAINSDLNDLVYAEGASCSSEKLCLPGTRQGILDEVMDWVNQPADNMSPQLLWLYGVAGSGKSAIAHSISHFLKTMNWLGSSFCFDAANQATRGPHHLFSTIARDLADFDPNWKLSLWNAIKDNKALRKSHSIQSQFEEFLVRPGQNLLLVSPVVVVIDALDESGDARARDKILDILGAQLPFLPANFRIIVTSRPEPDIGKAFQNKANILCKDMASIDLYQVKQDIGVFIYKKLAGDTEKLLVEKWPNWCDILVEKADGLFQWASTACHFIEQPGCLPYQRFQILLESSRGGNQLDKLYGTILKQSFPYQDPDAMKHFQAVMETLLSVRKPVTRSSLKHLCFGQNTEIVQSILVPLGAVLSGVTSESIPIHVLHTSFRDFLVDKARSKKFHITVTNAHQNLTAACLDIMLKNLKFNICQLETSCKINQDVADVKLKIQDHIPCHLSYACTFWGDHLEQVDYDHQTATEVQRFMTSKLLYWLEVLSLTQEVNSAINTLQKIEKWGFDYSEDLGAFAKDAQAFVTNFWAVINQSVPHIYLSALPFAPEESLVAKQYLQHFQNTLIVLKGREKNWPQVTHTMQGHTGSVWCIAFSCDGKHLVSGADDKTIRIWDVETGHMIGDPLRGHTGSVWSVAFSSDGRLIASGSADKSVRIWDTQTGHTVVGPLKGHTEWVNAIAFSADNKQIASGSDDKTIRIWDSETGKPIGEPLNGHADRVSSVAFSPSSQYIVSGSNDSTVRLWDVETGHVVRGPLEEHTSDVLSVAFSPDSRYVASGSRDQTIRVWDVETGYTVGEPLSGHTGSVWSVSFSPNGKYIVSGSSDSTIRVWNPVTSLAIGEPLKIPTWSACSVAFSPDNRYISAGLSDNTVRVWEARTSHTTSEALLGQIESVGLSSNHKNISNGLDHTLSNAPMHHVATKLHTGIISCIVFSPGGEYVVSGSHDNTIRLWNAQTGCAIGGPLVGHTEPVTSVVFLPDGKHIASSSIDTTIRVWNIETGQAVGGPLKGHTKLIRALAVSTSRNLFASASDDKTIGFWQIEADYTMSRPLEGDTDCATSIAFSSDGKHIVSGSWDGQIRVWNAETGQAVGKPLNGHTSAVRSVAFSPDGKNIASSSDDHTIRVWNLETDYSVDLSLIGHKNAVWTVVFSPDGKYIASGSLDQTIRIWRVETGCPVGEPLEGHTDWIRAVAFSPGSKYIASGSSDETIRIWDLTQATGPTTSPFHYGFSIKNGWAFNHEKIMFWVPFSNYNFSTSLNHNIIIGENPTYLDLSHFVYDTEWEECKTSLL